MVTESAKASDTYPACEETYPRVQNDQKIGNLCARLSSEPEPGRANGRRRTPLAVGQPRDDDAGPSAGRDNKASFGNGEDGETFGLLEDCREQERKGQKSAVQMKRGLTTVNKADAPERGMTWSRPLLDCRGTRRSYDKGKTGQLQWHPSKGRLSLLRSECAKSDDRAGWM